MKHSVTLLLVCLLQTSCLISESPFYKKDQIFKDPNIEGSFTGAFNERSDQTSGWTIRPYQPDGPDNWQHYKITVQEDDVKNVIIGTLFEIDGQSFLDLYPLTDSGVKKNPGSVTASEFMRNAFYKKRHALWKVDIDGDGISYSFPLGNSYTKAHELAPELKDMLKSDTQHTSFISDPVSAQATIAKLAKDPEVFASKGRLNRQK